MSVVAIVPPEEGTFAGPRCHCGAPIPDPRMSFCASCLASPSVQEVIARFNARVALRQQARVRAGEGSVA